MNTPNVVDLYATRNVVLKKVEQNCSVWNVGLLSRSRLCNHFRAAFSPDTLSAEVNTDQSAMPFEAMCSLCVLVWCWGVAINLATLQLTRELCFARQHTNGDMPETINDMSETVVEIVSLSKVCLFVWSFLLIFEACMMTVVLFPTFDGAPSGSNIRFQSLFPLCVFLCGPDVTNTPVDWKVEASDLYYYIYVCASLFLSLFISFCLFVFRPFCVSVR